MWKSFYEHSRLLEYPIIAMFIFMAVFLVMAVWTLRESRVRPSRFNRAQALPLKSEGTTPAKDRRK